MTRDEADRTFHALLCAINDAIGAAQEHPMSMIDRDDDLEAAMFRLAETRMTVDRDRLEEI